MKTALQELIEWMKDQYYPAMYEDEILKKATELLEKEREQIENAHANGIHDASACINGEKFKTSEEYYNETFKQ